MWEEGSVNAKLRGIHFDRDYENDSKDREQSAVGLELGYSSGYLGDLIGFDVTGDHGRNPFPTRSVIAPDLTGKNEDVWQLRTAYDWANLVPGLTTKLRLYSRSFYPWFPPLPSLKTVHSIAIDSL